MFQVAASHPAGFAKAYPYPSSHHQAAQMHSVPAPSNAVKLPRTLSRPPFAEVSRDAIAAVAPELASVPSEYIRRGLRTQAKDMLSGLSSVSSSHVPSSMPRSRLPSALTVPVRPGSNPGMVPTHVLAVSSSTAHSDSVSVFPIHALLLAAVCTKLPRLPATAPAGSSATLPVLPLSLPSPAAFSLLHSWLYNPTPATILRSLVPMPSSFVANLTDSDVRAALSNGQTLHSLAAYLVSASASGKGSAHTLTSHAAHVKELWQDVVALGIHDPDLWGILDLAWEVVLGALNLAATQNH